MKEGMKPVVKLEGRLSGVLGFACLELLLNLRD